MPPPAQRRFSPLIFVGVTLAYAVAGWLGVQLAVPPSIISPLFPAAGIALAAVLFYGNAMALATWLGAILFALVQGWYHDSTGQPWLNTIGIAAGAGLQPWLGAYLVRRWGGFPSALEQPGAILRFLLVSGPFTSIINATWSTAWLLAINAVPMADAPFAWWTWWTGDATGITIVTPILISVLSPQREDWDRRRTGIIVPYLLAGFFMVLAVLQTSSREAESLRNQFERDTTGQAQLLRSRFEDQLTVLQALERHITANAKISQESFHLFTATWFDHYPGMAVLGWAELTPAGELADLTARMRATGTPGFTVFDRGSDNEPRRPPAKADDYLVVRYAEPTSFNASAIGLNLFSITPSQNALARTRQTGEPQASTPLRLVQDPEHKLSIVVYQGVFRRDDPIGSRFEGVVYTAFRLDDILSSPALALPSGVSLCLIDRTDGLAPLQLAGPRGCETLARPGVLRSFTPFAFAGRQWEIRFVSEAGYLAEHRSWESWYLLLGSHLLILLLGAFLLVTTAHTQRIGQLVERRTAELTLAKARLEANQTFLAQAQHIARLGSWVWEAEGQPAMTWSDELFQLFGLQPGEVEPSFAQLAARFLPAERPAWESTLAELRAGRTAATLDSSLLGAEGKTLLVRLELQCTHANGRPVRLVGTLQDVTRTRETEAHIHYLAHYDTLTNLPNRSLLRDRVNQALAAAQRHDHPLALLFIDLDRFKKVNDTLGHPVGDRLLATAAQRLRSCIRDEDTMARIGGDEFMLLIPHIEFPAKAALVARKIVEQFARPFTIDQHDLTVTASIGIAVYPEDGADFDTLVKHADTAMFSAKEGGRNTFQFFTPEMDARAYERLLLENQLRRALERHELTLFYQPQIATDSGRIVGAEALVRWRHPERGLVPPAQFIPLAEESGLIVDIGTWVLTEACRQQVAWRQAGLMVPRIAVNISALQFRRTGFVNTVRRTLAHTGADPAGLELELTESALMEPSEDTEHQLASLKDLGLTLSLDDFGTGYSSLTYLKRYPLDQLKIDRSFIRDLPGDAEDAAITSATLSLGNTLGLTVVAEGVETPAQREFVTSIGCHVIQGFLFSPPLPVAEFEAFLAQHEVSRPPDKRPT